MVAPPTDSAAWRGRRVLVTGASGFIGANLIRRLVAAGAEVHGTVRPAADAWRIADCPVRLHEANALDALRMAVVVAEVGPDVVFDAVVIRPRDVIDDTEGIARGNVDSSRHLVAACAAAGVQRLVAMGSSLEYGQHDRPLVESMAPSPANAYARAKCDASRVVLDAAERGDLSAVVLRIFSVYGAWESPRRLVPRAIVAALTGRSLPLTPPGSRHDFICVDDVIDACLAAADAPAADGLALNIGTGIQVTNEAVIDAVAKAVGRPLDVRVGAHLPRPFDTRHWVADIELAARVMNWRPRSTLASGIQRVAHWIAQPAQLVRYERAFHS
jgi:nucleoside-diphosphate-sugar epimerase